MLNVAARQVDRIEWADGAKAISILLVAFHHANILADSQELSLPLFSRLDRLLTPIRMPLFFTISGVFAGRLLSKPWRVVMRRRVISYYYLYAVWLVLSWLFYRYIQVDLRHADEEQSVRSLFPMFVVPTGGLWFLWVLALYFAFGRLVNRARGAILLLALALPAVLVGSQIIPLRYPLSNVFLYAPFFYGAAWYGDRLIATVPRYPRTLMCFGTIAYGLLLTTAARGPLTGSTLLLSVPGLCLALGATVMSCRLPLVQSLLSYLGRNTLPIYVMHGKLINLLLVAISGVAAGQAFWIVPTIAITAVAGSLALARLLGAFGTRWLYSVDGAIESTDAIVMKLRAAQPA